MAWSIRLLISVASFVGFRRAVQHDDFIRHHLRSAEFLPQAVVQFARDAAALVVLRGDQVAGEGAQFAVQDFQLLRLAVQIGKHADLGPQQFGNDGNGNDNRRLRAGIP